MSIPEMFGPLYAAGARLGIAPADLDRSPPHVVAWMLDGLLEETPAESDDDLISLAAERERRKA